MLLATAESSQSNAGLVIGAVISVLLFWIPLYLVVRLIWTKRKIKKQRVQQLRTPAPRSVPHGYTSTATVSRPTRVPGTAPVGGEWLRATGDTIPEPSQYTVIFEAVGHVAVGFAEPGATPYAVGNGAVAVLKAKNGQIALSWAIAGGVMRKAAASLFGPMGVNNIVYSAATEAVFVQWQDRPGHVAIKHQRLLHFASVSGAEAFACEIAKVAPNAESNL